MKRDATKLATLMKVYADVFAYLKYTYPNAFNAITGVTRDEYGDFISLRTIKVEYELIYGQYSATEDYEANYELLLDNDKVIYIYAKELQDFKANKQ